MSSAGNLKRWLMPSQGIISNPQELLTTLLEARGITKEKQDAFLHPDYTQLYDPFLFTDMRKACERIFTAINNKEKITIHGDYDADGVCSSTLLSQIIKDLGGEVDVYIPHREKEGYGVAMPTVQIIADRKTTLLVTVDCGSANKEALEYAQSIGIDVIITDHHHVPQVVPQVFALINPQNQNDTYPFGYLCGTGVAFKVAQALYSIDAQQATPRLSAGYDKWLLDLVAIATVADMMDVRDENRILIHYGLLVLQKTKRKGLRKLMELAGLVVKEGNEITPFDIGFVIAPRLNAAGRMEHANAAYFLLSSNDEDEINKLAHELEETNASRKKLTQTITDEALATILNPQEKSVLVAYGEGWPIGLAGLVASRILQQYGKPAVVMTRLDDRIAGSARSVEGFNMATLLEQHRALFDTAGGHEYACGFSFQESVTQPIKVIELFESEGAKALEGKDLRPVLKIDASVALSSVTWELLDALHALRPYGNSNTEPLIHIPNLEIQEFKLVGEEKKHLRMRVKDRAGLKTIICIGFNLGESIGELAVGTNIELVGKISMNVWKDTKELQIKVEDLIINHI